MDDLATIKQDRDVWRLVAHRADARITEALKLALVGQIDGGHHKAWVIDQMVRTLMGPAYEAWVIRYENGGEYKWDTGIAP